MGLFGGDLATTLGLVDLRGEYLLRQVNAPGLPELTHGIYDQARVQVEPALLVTRLVGGSSFRTDWFASLSTSIGNYMHLLAESRISESAVQLRGPRSGLVAREAALSAQKPVQLTMDRRLQSCNSAFRKEESRP